jgi:hypothetical protein
MWNRLKFGTKYFSPGLNLDDMITRVDLPANSRIEIGVLFHIDGLKIWNEKIYNEC